MFHANLKSLWGRKRRLLSASTAVVIGVAFLVATLVLGDSMRNGFSDVFTEANAGIDLAVRNSTEVGADDYVQKGTLDAALVDELAAVPGVARVAASVEGTAQIVGSDGEPIGGDGPPTLAENWIDDAGASGAGFNVYDIAEGRAPTSDDEMVIDRGAAKSGSLSVGDTTTLLTPEPVTMTVVGIVTFGDDDSIGGSTFAGLTLDAAQQLLLADPSSISTVYLESAPGISGEELRRSVAPLLPADAEALTGAELTAEDNQAIGDDFLSFFEAFLLAFAIVALLVATFSIHNTFSILVAQRTRESALLRALGASRAQILTSVGAEALVLGGFASGVGIACGIGLAAGLKALMDAAGFGLPSTIGLDVETQALVVGVVVGTIVTLFASVTPALKASRVAPLAALRDVAVDRSGTSKVRAALGVLVAGAGVALVFASTSRPDSALALAGLGALVTILGAVVLGPVVATLATGTIGAPIAMLRGRAGSLARRNAMRNPRRSAGTASALMFGTAIVALFATFGASMKASIDDIVDSAFVGDLVISRDDFSGAPLSDELVEQVAALPEVGVAVALSSAPVLLDGDDEIVSATDPARFAEVGDLGDVAGSIGEMSANGIAVSEQYADDHDWSIGTLVPVAFADGANDELTVQAIYAERSIVGDVIITSAMWDPHAGRNGHDALLVAAADGVSVADAKVAVQAVADRLKAPDVQDRDEFADSNAAEIDQMLGLVYGLLGLAVLIAVLGIANTLSLSIHERTRELGLLRAVGQSRSQLRSTVRWESVIIAIFGTVGGVALGTFLGWGIIRAMAAQEDIGVFAAPVPSLAVILVLALFAGVVAAVRPARRAAKLDILSAIATT